MEFVSKAEVTTFFDEFVEAFSTFSGAKVAERYQVPFLAVDATGAATAFSTTAEVARYFQTLLDDYSKQGCRSCRYTNLEFGSLGSASGLLTATWELLRGDGSAVLSWRESYVVVRKGARLVVCASVDHVA